MGAKVLDLRRARASKMADKRDAKMGEFDRFEWAAGWLRAGLHSTTLAVLTALLDHMNEDGNAWPRLCVIAEMTGKSTRTVRRHLREAEQAGWIKTQYRGHHSNLYAASTGHPCPPSRTPMSASTGHGCPPQPDTGVRLAGHPCPPEQLKEQLKEQSIEQHAAAGEREDEKTEVSKSSETVQNPDPDKNNTWAAEFSMNPIPESQRMDPMEFASVWESRTGERIKIFDTRGAGRSMRVALRYFSKPTIEALIQKASDPGVSNPWRFFIGCLKREAAGAGAPDAPVARPARSRKVQGNVQGDFMTEAMEILEHNARVAADRGQS